MAPFFFTPNLLGCSVAHLGVFLLLVVGSCLSMCGPHWHRYSDLTFYVSSSHLSVFGKSLTRRIRVELCAYENVDPLQELLGGHNTPLQASKIHNSHSFLVHQATTPRHNHASSYSWRSHENRRSRSSTLVHQMNLLVRLDGRLQIHLRHVHMCYVRH
ncbi:hypothetical protein C8Q75DRAFT_118769 [Abortiporus biennis]|nr:hypothetical protein C8Q75DRAFT_118769 [Abortiporus biennis]